MLQEPDATRAPPRKLLTKHNVWRNTNNNGHDKK